MPVLDIPPEYHPGSTGYVCVICESPVIDAMETSCGHKFCSYCITLWKKHHAFCPICTHEIGKLTERPSIDQLIEKFFSSADAGVQEERQALIVKRKEAMDTLNLNSTESEMKALTEMLRPKTALDLTTSQPMTRTGTASSGAVADKKKEVLRMLKESEKFERLLEGVYSKILTAGEKLTAREDQAVARLCGAAVGGKDTAIASSHGKLDRSAHGTQNSDKNGSFLAPMKETGTASGNAAGTTMSTLPTSEHNRTQPYKNPKEQQEIDALIELTDDVLRIDKFLQVYDFESLTKARDEDVDGDDDMDDEASVLSDESIRSSTVQLLGDCDFEDMSNESNFKIHPEVQKYLDKNGISVDPKVPKISKGLTPSANSLIPTRDGIEPAFEKPCTGVGSNASKNRVQRVRNLGNKASPTSTDLTKKILQCRESLLNLKQNSEAEPTMSDYKSKESGGRPDSQFPDLGAHLHYDDIGLIEDFDMDQVHDGGDNGLDHAIRTLGREPVRPTTSFQNRRQRSGTAASKLKKNLDIGNVSSLPAISTRDKSDKRENGGGSRPYTTELKKPTGRLLH